MLKESAEVYKNSATAGTMVPTNEKEITCGEALPSSINASKVHTIKNTV